MKNYVLGLFGVVLIPFGLLVLFGPIGFGVGIGMLFFWWVTCTMEKPETELEADIRGAALRRERNTAFENDDHEWAARELKSAGITDKNSVVAAFHKARLDCTDISDVKRVESKVWLHMAGLTDIHGDKINLDEPLPR